MTIEDGTADYRKRNCINTSKGREPLNKKKKEERGEEKRNEAKLSRQNGSITRQGPFPPNACLDLI